MIPSVEAHDPVLYWHQQFLFALSGLAYAVGALGEENASYAGEIFERLTRPVIVFPSQEEQP